MRVRLAALYGFAVEDCLYHLTYEKNVSLDVLENIDNQKMFRPTNCVPRKLLLNFGMALKILNLYIASIMGALH